MQCFLCTRKTVMRFIAMLALALILGLITGSNSILCPLLADVDQTVHLPHPTNCSRFLTCVHGIPTEQECPVGLHWNAAAGACDYPDKANCINFDASSILFDVSLLENGLCLPQHDDCPDISQHKGRLVFLKDTDCRNFHICLGGEKLTMSCPPFTFWKREQCVCGVTPDEECVASDRFTTLLPLPTDEPSGRVRRSAVTDNTTETEVVGLSEVNTEETTVEHEIGDREIIIQPVPAAESSAVVPVLSLFAAAGIVFVL